ncbi:topology modulation protein [Plantactinospora sp. CA-294935]|uniref:topology modulation protein n=1 Tax=Plantactinospora sp. CA-294935 TaxID=3240012 RepID=UPI003D916E27
MTVPMRKLSADGSVDPQGVEPEAKQPDTVLSGGSRTMKRIAVVGCGGSGKSTLARRLSGILILPLTHLDGIYYDGRWNPLSQQEFVAQQERLTAAERWVIEGNYAGTLPIRLAAADTVIFLDLPAVTCLRGVLQRRWRYRGGQHRTEGVYDRITWNFIRYVLGYRRTMRPRVGDLIQEHGSHAQLITLTSRRQANKLIDHMRRAECCRQMLPRVPAVRWCG